MCVRFTRRVVKEMMRGMTRLAMGAALAVALSLALVFTLLLVLLADLFCSLLCRRRHNQFHPPNPDYTTNAAAAAAAAAATEVCPPTPPLSKPALACPFFAHGVLRAPTSLLLTVPNLEAAAAAAAAPKPVAYTDIDSPAEEPISPCLRRVSSVSLSSCATDRFVYISNPIYDGVRGAADDGGSTPFETPDTSPSHTAFEEEAESDCSPQLTAIKKLPPKALLSAAGGFLDTRRRSLAASASATETNRASTSSSSHSQCSSPSW